MQEREMIHLSLARMSDGALERKYIQEAFDTNWVAPIGPNVDAFENDLEEFVNQSPDSRKISRKVVCVNSGTAALHLALTVCGVGPGDDVCVQNLTFCASVNPIVYVGARPVLIGSESLTWNMDPILLEKAILERREQTGKYPKAIIPVSLFGMPYQIDRIMEIAAKYDIPIIEDAAEGLGSTVKGRSLGTFGRFGVISFNGNKMITTSGGGALICESSDDALCARWYASQARDQYPYYHHTAVGYNYRMSNICAGIGRGQMTVLKNHIEHHRHIQNMYLELLSDVKGIRVHTAPEKTDYKSNFWLCTVTLDPSMRIKEPEFQHADAPYATARNPVSISYRANVCQPNENVEAMRIFLLSKMIETRPLWKPMSCQPVFDGALLYSNGLEEELFKVGLCLPSGPMVTDDDVRYIIKSIKDAID